MLETQDSNGYARSLAKFKERLQPGLIHRFSGSTLGDLCISADKIQHEQGLKGNLRYMQRLALFIEAISQLGSAIEMFTDSKELMAFIWGPMIFLLEIVKTRLNPFDKLLEAYWKIGSSIGYLNRYLEVFQNHPPAAAILEDFYYYILYFHESLLRVIQRQQETRWIAFDAAWKVIDSRLKYVLRSIQRRKELLSWLSGALGVQPIDIDNALLPSDTLVCYGALHNCKARCLQDMRSWKIDPFDKAHHGSLHFFYLKKSKGWFCLFTDPQEDTAVAVVDQRTQEQLAALDPQPDIRFEALFITNATRNREKYGDLSVLKDLSVNIFGPLSHFIENNVAQRLSQVHAFLQQPKATSTPIFYSNPQSFRGTDVLEAVNTQAHVQTLFDACKRGDVETAKQLLESTDVASSALLIYNTNGKWPLHVAAEEGHMDICDVLISCGARVNTHCKSILTWTPLHYAASRGNLEVCQLLISKGANIEARSMLGITPFYSAASNGHVEVCQLLVSNGADIGARDTNNKTSLHRAARLGDQGLEVCCLLIFEGAYLEAKDNEGRTPLHAGASVGTSRSGLEVCKLLLSKGADINAKDKSQTTPLHVAAYTGHTDIVHLFLHQEDVEADARDDQGKSPVYVAAERCNLEALRLMHASQKVDMRIRAPLEGMTILHVACKSSMDMVEYLVGQGLGDMADEECIWCLFQNLQGLTRKDSRHSLGKAMRTLLMPGEIVLSEVNRLKEVLVSPNQWLFALLVLDYPRWKIAKSDWESFLSWWRSTHLLSRGVGNAVDEFARRIEDNRSSTIVDG